MANRESDTTIRRKNGNVIFTNQQTQTFSEEDFVRVYNDNKQNMENLQQQKQQMEEQREEILDEAGEELGALNYVMGNDTPFDPETENLEGALGDEAFEKHQKLEQLKEQIENLNSQEERLHEQLDSMRPVAEEIVEENEDLEIDPEQEE